METQFGLVLTVEKTNLCSLKYVMSNLVMMQPKRKPRLTRGGRKLARCYILASMSNVLQHRHQDMFIAYDMVKSLKEMFGDKNCPARQVAMKELMNTNIAEGTSVRDHILKMMSHLNELEILEAEIDGGTRLIS